MTKYKVEVCKVKDVVHHPNADRLDIVTVKGWKCITGRDDHAVGDLVIFVPPDSLVTDAFVEKFNITYLKGKGTRKRIGAVKLRGEWSEGLVLPAEYGWKAGDDVAEHYNIVKWEPLPQKSQSTRGSKHMKKMNVYAEVFPKYTSIENIRNYPDILEDGEAVYIVEKIHGTNFRAGWVPIQGNRLYVWLMNKLGKGWKFLVGSHNVILDSKDTTYYNENVYAWIADAYRLKEKLPKGIIVYGEIYGKTLSGAEIQKGYSYGVDNPEVVFFDIAIRGKYVQYSGMILLESLNLPTAPLVDVCTFSMGIVEAHLVAKSKLDNTTEREGLVIRPVRERTHPRLGRVILKAISPAYLAKKERTEGH